MRNLGLFAVVAFLLLIDPVSADTLKLKDGTKLEGRVIPQGENYWVKLPDGSTRTVAASSVAEWLKDGAGSGDTTSTDAPGSPKNAAPNFTATKTKADRCEIPLAATAMWQGFIDAYPTSPDLAAAKKELEFWQKRVDDGAEKIKGKWVGGKERKALFDKIDLLTREADRHVQANQTLQAQAKFEEVFKIYPNHFTTNFWLGLFNLQQDKLDKAQENMETALRVNPESAEAHTNYAIILNRRKLYEKSVQSALKAAELKETREIVQNLINACSYVPPNMQERNKAIQPAMQAGQLLAGKYGIRGPGAWAYVGLRPANAAMPGDPNKPPSAGEMPPGVVGMGSGFIVSADGLIITNKHVASVGDLLKVQLPDGSQKPAERIVMDDELDLAIIKIKPDKPLPFVYLADAPPGPGAECTALGYPLGNVFGITLQVSPGTVSSVIREKHADLVVTCKVNPGNSGGPLCDKQGNVAGIVTFKTRNDEMTDSYGLAIGSARVRAFVKKNFDKHKTELPAAPAAGEALNTEAVYKKVSPAAVCIIMIRSGEKVDAKRD